MNNQTVKIAAHKETKQVVQINPDKPEFAQVMIVSEIKASLGDAFVGESRKRVAFKQGRTDTFKEMNLQDGQVLKGKIIRTESRTPLYPNHQPKKYPDNAKSKAGEVFLLGGLPVYFQDEYTEDNNAQDTLIRANQIIPVISSVEEEIAA